MQATNQAPQNDFGNNGGEEKINVLVAKKSNKNKKRINLSSVPSASIPSASTNGLGPSTSMSSAAKGPQTIPVHDFGQRAPRMSSFPSPAEQPFESSHTRRDWNMDMDADMDPTPIASFDGSISQVQKGKTRGGSDEGKAGLFVRNLGGNVHRGVGVVKEISSGSGGGGDTSWRDQQDFGLSVPPVMTYLSCEVEGTANDILEVWNYENGGEWFFVILRL